MPPKVTASKIHIVIRSFDNPFFENYNLGGLTRHTRKIGLPESRVLYTVLRSPHIDKKSREQFEMEIKKQFLVIKMETHELRKKFFRLKRRGLGGHKTFWSGQKSCRIDALVPPCRDLYLKKRRGGMKRGKLCDEVYDTTCKLLEWRQNS